MYIPYAGCRMKNEKRAAACIIHYIPCVKHSILYMSSPCISKNVCTQGPAKNVFADKSRGPFNSSLYLSVLFKAHSFSFVHQRPQYIPCGVYSLQAFHTSKTIYSPAAHYLGYANYKASTYSSILYLT